MAVALVQSKVRALGSGSPLSLTLDAAPTSGNILAIVARGMHTSAIGGGVSVWNVATVGSGLKIMWGQTDGSSSVVSLAGGRSDSAAFVVMEFSGATYAASGVAPQATAAGTSTAPNSGNVSPLVRSLLIGGIDAASAVWSSGFSGWTDLGETTANSGSVFRAAWRVADAGTYAASGTLSSSVTWGAAVLALAETAASGSGPVGVVGNAGIGVACDIGFTRS